MLVARVAVTRPGVGRFLSDVTSPASPLDSLVQYGPLGLMVLGFITGWIVPGPMARRLEAENARLTRLIEDKLLPMTETYGSTLQRTAEANDATATAMVRLTDTMERLLRQTRPGTD